MVIGDWGEDEAGNALTVDELAEIAREARRDTQLEPESLQAGPVDPIVDQWLRFKPMFAELMQRGMWTLADLEAKVISKRAFLFPGKESALIGEIQIYPGGAQIMHITFGVGEAAELLSMEPGILSICRMLGCSALVVEGRLGWMKLLKPLGYEPLAVTMIKAV